MASAHNNSNHSTSRTINFATGATTSFLLPTVRNKDGSAFIYLPDEPTTGPTNTAAVPANQRSALVAFRIGTAYENG